MRRRLTTIIAAVSLVAVGVAAGAATQRFTDVPEDHWAAEPIEWAVEAGIMRARGDGTVFEPDKSVTRAKLAQILYRHNEWVKNRELTINEALFMYDVVFYEADDGTIWETSYGFDNTHSWAELYEITRSLCKALGDTPANASLTEAVQVVSDWLGATEWKKSVTDKDKLQIVWYGSSALCDEYTFIRDAWDDAGHPGLNIDWS